MPLSEMSLIEIVVKFGTVGLIFLIWYLQHRAEVRSRAEAAAEEKERREADRKEHMAKWQSMIQQQNDQVEGIMRKSATELESERRHHRELTDRAYSLIERQTSATEMLAVELNGLNEKVMNNKFCPIKRLEEKS